MKALIVVCAVLFPAISFANTVNPSMIENTEAVVRVNIGDEKQGSGLVVSTDGYILITAFLADACDDCKITVSAAGDKKGSYPAKMLAFDRTIGLAVIKTDHTFTRAIVLEDYSAIADSDETVVIGRSSDDTIGLTAAPILSLSYSDDETRRLGWSPCTLVQYMGAPGMLGAGAFNDRTGRLVGAVLGGHRLSSGIDKVYSSALAQANTIRLFLYVNRVPYKHPRSKR